jgi:hypothetical protein
VTNDDSLIHRALSRTQTRAKLAAPRDSEKKFEAARTRHAMKKAALRRLCWWRYPDACQIG